MMKSVILLLMILGVGGWVLSHSASYIAHRRAAHGPLTRDFFHGNSEIPPAFRQALEETIVFLDNRRDWAAGSALDAGTTDLCWIEIKDCDLCSGLVSFLLETWDASRSAGACPSCPRVRCPSADRRRPN